MPDIPSVLKQEIARISKKQAKALVAPVRKSAVSFRKAIAELKRRISALERENRQVCSERRPTARAGCRCMAGT